MGTFFVPTFQVKCMEVLPSWVTAVEGKTAQEQAHVVSGHEHCEPPGRVRGGERTGVQCCLQPAAHQSQLVHWEDPEGWYGEGGGRGDRDGNTCKSMADSCQCMAKSTTIL